MFRRYISTWKTLNRVNPTKREIHILEEEEEGEEEGEGEEEEEGGEEEEEGGEEEEGAHCTSGVSHS